MILIFKCTPAKYYIHVHLFIKGPTFDPDYHVLCLGFEDHSRLLGQVDIDRA